MNTTICPDCGKTLQIGDFPFCPHGQGRSSIERDEIPGGVWIENAGPHPVQFFSHSERRAYNKAHGLQEREKFSPMPGTDIDPQGIPNPKGYVDAYTLEQGRILMLRQQGTPAKEWDAREAGVLVGEFNEVVTERDAKAFASGDVHRQARIGRRTNGR